jgi:hypothetical protein
MEITKPMKVYMTDQQELCPALFVVAMAQLMILRTNTVLIAGNELTQETTMTTNINKKNRFIDYGDDGSVTEHEIIEPDQDNDLNEDR